MQLYASICVNMCRFQEACLVLYLKWQVYSFFVCRVCQVRLFCVGLGCRVGVGACVRVYVRVCLVYMHETYDFKEPTNRSHPIYPARTGRTGVCIHAHTNTHTHIHTYTHTHTQQYTRRKLPNVSHVIHTHTIIHTCSHIYKYTYIHTYTHTHIHTYTHTHIHTYTHTQQQRRRELANVSHGYNVAAA